MSLNNYGKMTDERLAEIFKASIEVSGFYAQTEEEHWQVFYDHLLIGF